MMWNWLVVGLFTGCSLFLYDGSPLLPTPSIMWDLVDKLGEFGRWLLSTSVVVSENKEY